MARNITPQEIEEMREFLRNNPIDHSYDEEAEFLDNRLPPKQSEARLVYELLKELGELGDLEEK